MTLAWLRRSLKTWEGRLTSRRARLALARKEGKADDHLTMAEAARIHNWRGEVSEAEAIVSKRRKQIAARTPRPANGRAKVVAVAGRYVGVTESPNGSNSGGIITTWQQRLGFGRVPWCGCYVGNMMMAAGVRGVTSRIASVALIEDDARAGRGPFTGWSRRVARPGDLAVIGGRGVHVELVVGVYENGSLETIGGNVSNGVRRVRRPPSQVHGIAQVRYS